MSEAKQNLDKAAREFEQWVRDELNAPVSKPLLTEQQKIRLLTNTLIEVSQWFANGCRGGSKVSSEIVEHVNAALKEVGGER